MHHFIWFAVKTSINGRDSSWWSTKAILKLIRLKIKQWNDVSLFDRGNFGTFRFLEVSPTIASVCVIIITCIVSPASRLERGNRPQQKWALLYSASYFCFSASRWCLTKKFLSRTIVYSKSEILGWIKIISCRTTRSIWNQISKARVPHSMSNILFYETFYFRYLH